MPAKDKHQLLYQLLTSEEHVEQKAGSGQKRFQVRRTSAPPHHLA